MLQKMLAGLVVLGLCGTAWADGSASIRSGGEAVTMEYLKDMVRFNMDSDDAGYMVVRDGRVYSVMGGQVFDATSMMEGMAADMATPTMDIGEVHGLKATGSSETVAGIPGEVHILDFSDEAGERRQAELVLSDDRRARDLQKAFNNMATTFASVMDEQQLEMLREMEKVLDGRGILRYDQEMQVESFADGAPDASRFELPGKPQDLRAIGGAIGEALGGGLDELMGR